MIQEIQAYKKIVSQIPDMIKESYYKKEFFIKTLGLKHATFYRKLKACDFTADEVEKIILLLKPEEKLLLNLTEGYEDFKNGKIENFDDVMKDLRKQYPV